MKRAQLSPMRAALVAVTPMLIVMAAAAIFILLLRRKPERVGVGEVNVTGSAPDIGWINTEFGT